MELFSTISKALVDPFGVILEGLGVLFEVRFWTISAMFAESGEVEYSWLFTYFREGRAVRIPTGSRPEIRTKNKLCNRSSFRAAGGTRAPPRVRKGGQNKA